MFEKVGGCKVEILMIGEGVSDPLPSELKRLKIKQEIEERLRIMNIYFLSQYDHYTPIYSSSSI